MQPSATLARPWSTKLESNCSKWAYAGWSTLVCANQFHRPRDRTAFFVVLMILAVFEVRLWYLQALSKSDAVLQWARPEGYRGRASGHSFIPITWLGSSSWGWGWWLLVRPWSAERAGPSNGYPL